MWVYIHCIVQIVQDAVVPLNWNSLEKTHICMIVVCCLAKPYYTGDDCYFNGKVSGYWLIHENRETFPPQTICNNYMTRWLDYCTSLAVGVDITHTFCYDYSEFGLK